MFEPFAKAVVRANQVLNEQDKVAKKTAASVAKSERDKTKSVEAEAKAQVKAWQAADKNVVNAHKAATKEIGSSDKDRAKSAKQAADLQMEAWKAADRNVLQAHKAAEKEATAATKEEARERARIAKQVAKDAAKAEKDAAGGGSSFLGGYARFAARRMLWSAGSYAVSLPGRLAAGMGVDPQDIGSLMQNQVARRNLAADISNVGYIPGEAGPNGRRQSAGAIDAEAMKIATETASDPMKLLEGLHKFVGVTGDLKTGRDVMRDMARLALATGASMEDMVAAAGEMSARLGDTPDKVAIIESTMRHLSGMGLKGAMLPEDVAKEMPKIAGLAPQFAGGTADNIGKLFALVQEARQVGGAGSASQAATMLRGYVNAASNSKRLADSAALTQAGGGGRFGFRDERGMLRDVGQVIPEMIRGATDKQTGVVNVAALSKAMGGMRGMGSIMGLVNKDIGAAAAAYQEGQPPSVQMQEGMKAVAAEFERLNQATMSRTQVEESVQAKLGETKQQAQLFNNKLQAIVDEAMPQLTNSLLELGPAVLQCIPAMTQLAVATMGFVSWLVNSPIGQMLGLGEKASATAGATIDDTYRAERALRTHPTGDSQDAAKAQIVKDWAEASALGSTVNRQRDAASYAGDHEGDSQYAIGPGGEALRENEASLRHLIEAVGVLTSRITTQGIPVTVQNPKDMHPSRALTQTVGKGVQPAARQDDW